MILLIFFALPLATILLAIVLQKILKCPILVAITFFALYLIAVFILFATGIITNLGFALVAVIVYAIIAFITAWIVKVINMIRKQLENNDSNCRSRRERCCDNNQSNQRNTCEDDNNDLLRISCRCNNGNSQDLLTINSDCLGMQEENENNRNSCGCGNNIVNGNNRSCNYRKCNPKSI